MWDLYLCPITHPDMKQFRDEPLYSFIFRFSCLTPRKANAFICNLMSHWFAIRKIDGIWWDVNSIYDLPNALSDLYLGYESLELFAFFDSQGLS